MYVPPHKYRRIQRVHIQSRLQQGIDMATEMLKIKLTASDGKTFEVDQDVAFKSQMIKDMCSNLGIAEGIEVPVTEADGETLKKIIDYCVDHRSENYVKKTEKEDQRIDLTETHKKYLDGVSDELVMKLLTGANFLDIAGLLDILTQHIANMIKGKGPAEIREIYMMEDDLPEEQKQEVRKKYEWLDI